MTMKLIPEQEVPQKRGKWKKMLEQIPEGNAWVIVEGDVADVKINSVRIHVQRLIKSGKLPNYRVVGRNIDGKQTVFIIHHKEELPST